MSACYIVRATVRQYGQWIVVLSLYNIPLTDKAARVHFYRIPQKNRHWPNKSPVCAPTTILTSRSVSQTGSPAGGRGVAFETSANRPRGRQTLEWMISLPLSHPPSCALLFCVGVSIIILEWADWVPRRLWVISSIDWLPPPRPLPLSFDRPHWWCIRTFLLDVPLSSDISCPATGCQYLFYHLR